jgi:putative cobalt transporter subunit CbtB
MSIISRQISKEGSEVPKIAVGILLGILVFGMFAVGYDQGQLAEAFLGSIGIHPSHTQLMMLHEFNHDLRHAAGFPCH